MKIKKHLQCFPNIVSKVFSKHLFNWLCFINVCAFWRGNQYVFFSWKLENFCGDNRFSSNIALPPLLWFNVDGCLSPPLPLPQSGSPCITNTRSSLPSQSCASSSSSESWRRGIPSANRFRVFGSSSVAAEILSGSGSLCWGGWVWAARVGEVGDGGWGSSRGIWIGCFLCGGASSRSSRNVCFSFLIWK